MEQRRKLPVQKHHSNPADRDGQATQRMQSRVVGYGPASDGKDSHSPLDPNKHMYQYPGEDAHAAMLLTPFVE